MLAPEGAAVSRFGLGAEHAEDDPLDRGVPGEELAHRGDGDVSRAVEGKAIDAGGDRGESDAARADFPGDLQRGAIAGGEQRLLVLAATAPHRTHGVDHVLRLEVEPLGVDGIPGVAAADPGAGLTQVSARGAVDRTAHAAAGPELSVGGVHDGVDIEPGDVAGVDLDAPVGLGVSRFAHAPPSGKPGMTLPAAGNGT